jgi:hypothetical protein
MPEREKEQAQLAAINEIIKTIGSSLDLRQATKAAFALEAGSPSANVTSAWAWPPAPVTRCRGRT